MYKLITIIYFGYKFTKKELEALGKKNAWAKSKNKENESENER